MKRIGMKLVKFLSFALSLMLMLSSVPLSGVIAFAAEENFTIQYLNDGVVKSGVELKLKPDENSDTVYTGTTDEKGLWETEVKWSDLSETFVVYVDGDSKTVLKSEEEKQFLILDKDERSWADKAVPVEGITVEANGTEFYRGDSLTITSTVKGTPDTYQWYFGSSKIDGETSSSLSIEKLSLSDSGKYSCEVTDTEGNKRSDSVTIDVKEKTADGAVLKAYANGEEVDGIVERNNVNKVELRVENLPDDAEVEAVKFYVNDECLDPVNTELSADFDIESGVEEYECRVEITFEKIYEPTTLTLPETIKAEMLEQEAINVEVSDPAKYDGALHVYTVVYASSPKTSFDISLSGGSSDGDFSLEIIEEKLPDGTDALYDGKVATANKKAGQDKWEITAKNAGTFTVRIIKAGDSNYKDSEPVLVNFVVEKATIEGLSFETVAPEAIVYNTNNNEFTNVVVDGFDADDIKYSIESGDCATVDENTGKLTVLKAGTVVVKATLAESDNYNEATATYTLTVNKATQTIEFEDKEETVFYGQSYQRIATPVADSTLPDGYGYNHDEGVVVTYMVETPEGEEIFATAKEDGTLEFENQKIGTVTVKAVLPANDCYEEATATYTVTVSEYRIENAYTITGDMTDADNEWYCGDITITPAENHLIGKTNNLGDTNEWSESIVISTEGVSNGMDVYFKNIETGAITTAYTISSESLKLDKSAPYDLKIKYETSSWYEEILDTITFGYYNSVVTFVMEAKDDISGVEFFKWSFTPDGYGEAVSGLEVYATAENGVYVSEKCVLGDENDLKELRGKISFFAYDYAGNSSEYEDTYVVVIDTDPPIVDITVNAVPECIVNNEYPYEYAEEDAEDGIEIYKNELEVTFSVIDKNFFPTRAKIIINGEEKIFVSWTAVGDNHLATIELEDDGDYDIQLKYEDIFGEDSSNKDEKTIYEKTRKISIDRTDPVVDISLVGETENDIEYFKDDVTAVISVKDAKFNPAKFTVSSVNGYIGMSVEDIAHLSEAGSWKYEKESGTYVASVVFEAKNAEGKYAFAADYTSLTNVAASQAQSEVFVIDQTAPVVSATYGDAKILDAQHNVIESFSYEETNSVSIFDDEKVVVTFTVYEINFDESKVKLFISEDAGEFKEADFDGEWKNNGSIHTNTVTLEKGKFKLKLTASDCSNNELENGYSTPLIIIDDTVPQITFEYKIASETEQATDSVYFNKDVNVNIYIFDEYFSPKGRVSFECEIKNIHGDTLTLNDELPDFGDTANWKEGKNSNGETYHYITLKFTTEGRYVLTVDYTDAVGKKQTASGFFVLDKTAPEYTISYSAELIEVVANTITFGLYNPSVTVTVTVTDDISGVSSFKVSYPFNHENGSDSKTDFEGKSAEFIVEELDVKSYTNTWEVKATHDLLVEIKAHFKVVAKDNSGNSTGEAESIAPEIIGIDNKPPVISSDIGEGNKTFANNGIKFIVYEANFDASLMTISAVAKDSSGDPVDFPEEFKEYFQTDIYWIKDIENPNKHTLLLTSFTHADGRTITLEDAKYVFTVTGKDLAGNVAEDYVTKEVIVDRRAPNDHRISYSDPQTSAETSSGVVYKYYNGSMVVTYSVHDATSGVTDLEWTYTKERDASNVNIASQDGMIFFDNNDEKGTVSAEVRMPIDAKGQYRGNFSFVAQDEAGNLSEVYTDRKTVIVIDTIAPVMEVEYEEPINEVDSFENGGKRYYDSSTTAKIIITEANFYPEDVDLKINGEAYSEVSWTNIGDVWTGTVYLNEDGKYVISVDYSDRSNNKAESYTSGEIIIDTQNPVISVSYSPDNVLYTEGNRKFYNEEQTATITITEENFDPEDVIATIPYEDIDGKDLGDNGLATSLKNASAWTHDGNKHTATIKYSTDGNYRFNIEYTDLSGRSAEAYAGDELTIDKTAPEISEVEFGRTSVSEVPGMGFYNNPVTVTVSAEDTTSGVKAFEYVYTSALTGESIRGTVDARTSGSTATGTFSVPGNGSDQFKGTVKVSAFDNSGNKSDVFEEDKVIVVDSIAPNGSINLSGQASDVNGTKYFAGNATATISITEANFDDNDVVVLVDGNQTATGTWTPSGDTWTTTVVVSADGQHKISVSYTDKSGNRMNDVQSQPFVVDHTAPEITVNGINGNTAYIDEVVGFTVTVSDENFNASGIEAVLTVVVKNEDGVFETKNIPMDNIDSISNGCVIRVENLEEDGIYTLTCKASDYSGNETNTINISGTGSTGSVVTFSVNRNGSTYDIDSTTKDIINKYYISEVGKDLVITEVNVAPLTKYSVKVNDVELEEGVDFTVQKVDGEGEWYRYTYSIKAHNFEAENSYNVVITSEDGTSNVGYSDIKGAAVRFVVDNTSPTVTLSGIEANGRYQTDKQVVSVIPSDAGGKIASLKVEVTDRNGEVMYVPFDAAGEDLMDLLDSSDGVLKFEIKEGSYQNIRIICVDEAGNEYISEDEYTNITVSSNRLVLLWASTAFRVGAIGGLVLVAGAIILIIFLKKKKKEEA